MGSWIEDLVIGLVKKYLTPEILAQLELVAKKYVVNALREVAKQSPGALDDKIVEIVAGVLGVK